MSQLVALYAVPHTPSFVAEAETNGPMSEPARLFAAMRTHLERAAPDILVTIGNDHFNTFFFDNWPSFAIGIADGVQGPSDQTPCMPWYDVAIDTDGARYLHRHLCEAGFEFAASASLQVDHGTLVPLHFMTPDMRLPIVPIFVNCLVPPLPVAWRCHRLGWAIRSALGRWPGRARVAVLASGSLSLEIGGPRAAVGKTFGVPDPAWASWVLDRVRSCEHEALIEAATEPRMLAAGNVSGELLNWIVALGIAGRRAPETLIEQPAFGNAFAAWGAAEVSP